LQARTYKPTASPLSERDGLSVVRDLVVQAALRCVLESAFPPAGPRDLEPEKTIRWLAGNIEKDYCRVYTMTVNGYPAAQQHEHLLARLRQRVEDTDLLRLLADVLAALTKQLDTTPGPLTPLLADLTLDGIDAILEQAQALGREGSFLHVRCTRVANHIAVLTDLDPRYEWICPAVQKRLRDGLAELRYAPAAVETQSADLTRGEKFHFLGFELHLVNHRRGKAQVRYRPLEQHGRPAEFASAAFRECCQPWRWMRPSFRWVEHWHGWRVSRDAVRKVSTVQVGWRHLPVTLYPVVACLLGWCSPAAWICLALVFVCNWWWLLGFARWAGQHKLDVALGMCAAATLVCLYPSLSDIYTKRPREVAASPDLPRGFYLGEYHGDSWWHGEATPVVNYGLYVPPNFEGQKGPFPLIVFLHGYGERSRARIFKAGLPLAITQRFGTNKPNGDFQFLAFFPIDPTGKWGPGSAEVEGAMKALNYVIRRHRVDPSRVYLTGLSSGGSGVWGLAESYPDRWTALAPVCAFVSPEVSKVRHLPAWIYHGDKDAEAPVERERELVRQLTAAGAEVRYRELPNQGHGIWAEAYEPKDLYEWFASKKKG
jgi:predicted esterase